LSADGCELSYVGATHWAAILDNVCTSTVALFMANRVLQIKELKCDFAPGNSQSEEEDVADSNRDPGPDDSIFSHISPPNLEVILQSLPPRPMVDRRLSAYFKAKYATIREFLEKSAPPRRLTFLAIIHTYQFQRMVVKAPSHRCSHLTIL
jgi:hypothetical protein